MRRRAGSVPHARPLATAVPDPVPDVRAAGRVPAGREQRAENTLRSDINAEPAAGRIRIVGASQRRGEEPVPANAQGFGRPSGRSESAGAVISAGRRDGWVQDFREERAELNYKSSREEPLGKSHVRGHQMPEFVERQDFRFGRKTAGCTHMLYESEGKDVIAPQHIADNSILSHQQYVVSHQAFAPGEQVNRRYAWPAEIAQDLNYRFGQHIGARSAAGGSGVGAALGQMPPGEHWPGKVSETKVVLARDEDYKRFTHDPLGSSKGGLRPPVPSTFAFGVRTDQKKATAGDCIRGGYSFEEQLPDRDLGRCVKEGRRNIPPQDHLAQAFGMPSRGRQPQEGRSAGMQEVFQPPSRVPPDRLVANAEDIACALAPDRSPLRSAPEFSTPRPRADVQELLEAAGYSFGPEEFSDLWAACSSGDRASLDAVIEVYAASHAQR